MNGVLMTLTAVQLDFTLEITGAGAVKGFAGVALRGALGKSLRARCSAPGHCGTCTSRDGCAYGDL
ncbi:hypothetical protein JW905_10360, partial [bacterium]|nr:hypothetical protein [candidate division CSSED10-310 bacterium]